jgi:uncharacterized membrane protein YphA (DoxX/SURF4 family)
MKVDIKMRYKIYDDIIRIVVGCGLIIMACYHLFYMSFEVRSFKTIRFLPSLAREFLPLVIPLVELAFAYGILFGRKRKIWSVSLYYFLLTVTCFWIIVILNPWNPNCDCKGLLRFAEDIRRHNIIDLIANVICIFILLIYLRRLKHADEI